MKNIFIWTDGELVSDLKWDDVTCAEKAATVV